MDDILAATQRDIWWLPDSVERLDRADVQATRDASRVPTHNQVCFTGGPVDALPALVAEISAWQHTTSRWLVVPGQHREALLELLPAAGYLRVFTGDAFTMPVDAAVPEGDARVVRVHDRATMRDAIQAQGHAFGIPTEHLDVDRQLAMCTGPHARTARFVAYGPDGTVAGSGGINRHTDQRFGFLWGGCTVPAHRGRGVYRSLLAARQRWAAVEGLDHIGLYAKRTTSGPIVARVGFTRHGPMDQWDRV